MPNGVDELAGDRGLSDPLALFRDPCGCSDLLDERAYVHILEDFEVTMENSDPEKPGERSVRKAHWLPWVLMFIGFTCLAATGWLLFRPVASPPRLPVAQSESEDLPEENGAEESETEPEPLRLVNHRGSAIQDEDESCISECIRRLEADFDGDGEKEQLCVREAWIKKDNCRTPFHSLVVDLFKGGQWMLREHFGDGIFWEERFFLIKNLDGDGKAELITRVQLSPDCSGCVSYSVYAYSEEGFSQILNLFGVSPHSPQVADVYIKYYDILNYIEARYKIETARKSPHGWIEEPSVRAEGVPWLIDSDSDGRVEIVQLLDAPPGDDFLKPQLYRLFVMEMEPKKTRGPHRFYPLEKWQEQGHASLLGFLKARTGQVHALVNFAISGTSTAHPILNVFEMNGVKMKRVAELCGFYEHVIPDRLWDVNQDGNTEIIQVGSVYWPPGKSHAEVILDYEIMEYRNGKYVPTSPEIKQMAILRDDEEEGE